MGPTRNIEWLKPLMHQWTAELKHAILNNFDGFETVSCYFLNGAIGILGGQLLSPNDLIIDIDPVVRDHVRAVERVHTKDSTLIDLDDKLLEKYHKACQHIRAIIGRKKNENPANITELVAHLKDPALEDLKGCVDDFLKRNGLQEGIYPFLGKLGCYLSIAVYWKSVPDWIVSQFQIKNDGKSVIRKKIEGDPEIVAVFIEEGREITGQIATNLDALKNAFSADTVQAIKRDLHTLKGAARMVGLLQFGEYVHILEQIYMTATPEVPLPFDVLQSAHQYLGDMLDSVQTGYMPDSIDREVEALRVATGLTAVPAAVPAPAASVAPPSPPSSTAPMAPSEAIKISENFEEQTHSLRKQLEAIHVGYNAWKNTKDVGLASEVQTALLAFKKEVVVLNIKEITTLADRLPPQVEKFSDVTVEDMATILECFHALAQGKPLPNLSDASQNKKQAAGQTIRVSTGEISKFSNIASMMSVSRSNLEHDLSEMGNAVLNLNTDIAFIERKIMGVASELNTDTAGGRHLKEALDEVIKSVQGMGSVSNYMREMLFSIDNLLIQQGQAAMELRRGLTEMQLVPLSDVLPRFEKIVADVSKVVSKNVQFFAKNMTGKLDKQILDRLISPFEHMLRNAIDHGIESPEQRVAAGKPAHGTIILSGKHTGSQIILVLEDDGQGINVDKVRKKAIDRGLLDPAANLSNEEVMRFILQPGFTTKEAGEATYISGRGVGMDVVNTEVENLSGTILIDSVPGKGTTFTISIPFTQSLSEILLFTLDSYWYGIHAWNVENIVRVPYESVIEYLNGNSTFVFNNQPYSFRYMGALLHGEKHPAPSYKNRAMPVILLKVAETALAVLVDHVVGIRKVFLKSAGPQLQHVKEIAGATIMPDGRIVLVLDAMVLEHVVLHDRQHAHPHKKWTVLVVDDSETVRKTTKKFLERAQHQVILVKDGLEAMEALGQHSVNMVITDVDMPKMNGYELVTAIRADSRFQAIPVVMITSRNGEMHEKRAKAVGVTEMLTKPYDEMKLNDIMQRLLEKN